MQITDIIDPFFEFTKAFPNGSWEIVDGVVHFVTNQYLDDEHMLPAYKELFLDA